MLDYLLKSTLPNSKYSLLLFLLRQFEKLLLNSVNNHMILLDHMNTNIDEFAAQGQVEIEYNN